MKRGNEARMYKPEMRHKQLTDLPLVSLLQESRQFPPAYHPPIAIISTKTEKKPITLVTEELHTQLQSKNQSPK
jgi:hypothetical protein